MQVPAGEEGVTEEQEKDKDKGTAEASDEGSWRELLEELKRPLSQAGRDSCSWTSSWNDPMNSGVIVVWSKVMRKQTVSAPSCCRGLRGGELATKGGEVAVSAEAAAP